MADEEKATEELIARPFYLDRLDLPQDPSSPTRLDPTKVWRYLYNLRAHDGALRRGYGFLPCSPTVQLPTAVDGIGTTVNAWIAVFRQDNYPNPASADLIGSGNLQVVITSSDIIIRNLSTGGWNVATPTYSTGTVTATNGLTAITGAGTLWITNRLGTSTQTTMNIDGVWYNATITGETTATLATPFTGGTGGGKAYVARRWIGAFHGLIRYFNGDLYIAADDTSSSNPHGPVVIKVSSVLNLAGLASTYLTARTDMGATIDEVTTLREIRGMELLTDGRVVLATVEVDGVDVRNQRIRWSSHLSTAVWTVSPAGFTDVVGQNGSLNGLTSVRENLWLHFSDGIQAGIPNGQDTPPLNYRSTASLTSPFASRLAASAGVFRKLLVYVDQETRYRAFDGSADFLLSDAPAYLLNNPYSSQAGFESAFRFAHNVDRAREEVVASGEPGPVFGVNPENRAVWMIPKANGNAARLVTCYGIDGSLSFDTPGPVALGAMSSIIGNLAAYYAGKDNFENAPPFLYEGDILASNLIAYAESEDIDFGLPGVDKVIDRVLLWYSKTPYGNSYVELDGTGDYLNMGTNSVYNFTASGFSVEGWFYFDSLASEPILFGRGVYNVGGWHFHVRNNGAIVFLTNQGGANQQTTAPAGTVVTGQWVHLAATRSGASALIYKNGVQVSTVHPAHVNPASSTEPLRIGSYNGAGQDLDGRVKEARIWNVQRSAGNILAAYNIQVNRLDANLVGYWPMMLGNNLYVFDMSASAQHGTLIANATFGSSATPPLPFYPDEQIEVALSRMNGTGYDVDLTKRLSTEAAPVGEREYILTYYFKPLASEKFRLRLGAVRPLASDSMRSALRRVVIYYRPIGNIEAVNG